MAHAAPDDGFHEIQLNGKQLVFLFMAATVVSVVIFLCGVLVGRGVRAERSSAAEATAAADGTAADITPSQPPVAVAPGSADPTAAAPPPATEDLSYFKRLEEPKQPPEELKAPSKPAPAAASPQPMAKAPAPAPPGKASSKAGASAPPALAKEPPTGASAPTPPTGQGYAVQIAALNVRSEADAIARHLAAKGYAAYVLAHGSPEIYRVRIGTFKTKREAESVAARLQKEEQLKPFVTR